MRARDRCEGTLEDGNRCPATTRLEVHHRIPLEAGEPRHKSPKNRLDNLKVLCKACHEKAHHPFKGVPKKKRIPKEQMALFEVEIV